MAKRAQLADGTILEFPDDTPDAVMDQAVRARMQPAAPRSAGQQVMAGGKKALNAGLGALDVLGTGTRGTINSSAQTAAGLWGALKGAVRSDITARQGYAAGKAAEAATQQQPGNIFPPVGIQTPQGEQIAGAISNIPAPGGIPNEGDPNGRGRMGPTVNALGETIGGGIEKHLGPEARDVTRDAFALLTMRGGRPAPSGASAQAVARAGRAGYVVPPTTVIGNADPSLVERGRAAITGKPVVTDPKFAGSGADRAARALGGGSDVDARFAMRNQQVTQQLAAEAGRLPAMTPQAYARSVAEQNGKYDALKSIPLNVPLNSQGFYNRVTSLTKTPGWDPAVPASDAVVKLQNELLSVTPTVEGVVNRVRQLRADSFKNFDGDPEAQMLGRAQREAADILEDELESRLKFVAQNASNPNLRAIASRVFDEYIDAREQLAVLHDIRHGMNDATGTIDASRISRLNTDRPGKLAPGLQEIANAYDALGSAGMQTAEKASRAAGNPLGNSFDLGTGVIAGAASGGMTGSATNALVGGAIGALAIPFARYAAREFALRGPVNRTVTGGINNFVLRPGVTAAAVSQQLPEEQR